MEKRRRREKERRTWVDGEEKERWKKEESERKERERKNRAPGRKGETSGVSRSTVNDRIVIYFHGNRRNLLP